jgi:hypothetical protein
MEVQISGQTHHDRNTQPQSSADAVRSMTGDCAMLIFVAIFKVTIIYGLCLN